MNFKKTFSKQHLKNLKFPTFWDLVGFGEFKIDGVMSFNLFVWALVL